MTRKYERHTDLTESQRGKLGGLRAAAKMTPEQRAERSRKAGKAVLEARGKEFFVRLAFRRWGKKVEINDAKPGFSKSEKKAAYREQAARERADRTWAKDFILRGTRRGVPRTRPSAAAESSQEGPSGPAGGNAGPG